MTYSEITIALSKELDELKEKSLKTLTTLQASCDIRVCTPNNASLMISKSIEGWDHSLLYHSLSLSVLGRIKTHLDNVEAIIYLDESSKLLTEKGVKDTAEARKRIVDQHPDVIVLRDLLARITALETMLKHTLWKFRMVYDALKKVGMNEPSVGDNSFGG